MNILVWPTTFGADLWSLTRSLSHRPGTTVKVVLDNPDQFLGQGAAQLYPIEAELIKRRLYHHGFGLPGFNADVTIMDNRAPLSKTSRTGFMLWHGFGWKGPNDAHEMRWLHRSLRRLWGDIKQPNDQFRWQCFGPWDMKHRSEVSRIHEDNCRLIGAASHDDLRTPIDREIAQPYYPFDIVRRRTVLVAPTWHYGEIFAHWGHDSELLEKLIDRISAHNANVILRLHDSFRFEKPYLKLVQGIAARYPNVLLKFKDKSPDNYLDMQVSDVLVSNYSSIANLFYATGRPSVHIYPVRDADEAFLWRKLSVTGVKTEQVDTARFIWKLPPEEHGGLLAQNFDELLQKVDQALEEPECCAADERKFLDTFMMGADGGSCERAWHALEALVEGRTAPAINDSLVTSGTLDGGRS